MQVKVRRGSSLNSKEHFSMVRTGVYTRTSTGWSLKVWTKAFMGVWLRRTWDSRIGCTRSEPKV